MNPGKHIHSPVDPSCLEVFEKLSEYLDGELSPQDCRHIQEHIQDCAPCVAFVDSLKNSIQAVRQLGPGQGTGEVPPEVREKLKDAWQAALERREKK